MNAPALPPFRAVADLIHEHALARPEHCALRAGEASLTYAELDTLASRVAASLQRDGMRQGDVIALCAHASVEYVALMVGALRAGVVVAPIAPSVTPAQFNAMLGDAAPRWLFADDVAAPLLEGSAYAACCIGLDSRTGTQTLAQWLAPEGAQPTPLITQPEWPFNIIYSSGTTGTPKGIVQPHGMRWAHIQRGANYGYGPGKTTLLATPLYSNTTLVVLWPTLAYGGTAVLLNKFNTVHYLQLAQQHRVTHTMLVPVQYMRLMAEPRFGEFDLSSFQYKWCTSAPFNAALKADVLKRWPGGLVELYGMTEGGGTFLLNAHEFPHKLHTVGQSVPGHDIRFIDEEGVELPAGQTGEIVGHSPGMMSGYYKQPEKTREAEWFDATGKRFIRTGDVGRLDEDGFLVLMDRRKDMIISGGFNLYPSDLETELRQHPAVLEAAVVGVPSPEWGETPVAFVVLREGKPATAAELKAWCNVRVGKTQRLADVQLLAELPRSAIGKVLKRELREAYGAREGAPGVD
jgi:long-chain acyl-CoA synthetase